MVKQINSSFKLYQKYNTKFESTFFDLVNGKHEPKQTKCLAYLISKCPPVLKMLLHLESVRTALKNLKGLKNISYDFYRVDAEMLSNGTPKIRRDITISFYKENKLKYAIIIEAKSVSIKNISNLTSQLKQYFDKIQYPDDASVPKIGVSLSKYPYVFESEEYDFVSITWLDIIKVLQQLKKKQLSELETFLIQEYFTFITGADIELKFFEKEVLSVAAGKSFTSIEKHFIHGCPHNQKGYSYQDPLFITFRKSGGEMHRLYKIEEVVVVDTSFPSYKTKLVKSHPHVANRILSYLSEDNVKNNWVKSAKTSIFRFYVLSENQIIELSHKPKIEKTHVRNGIYFTLSELLDTNPLKKFVKTAQN